MSTPAVVPGTTIPATNSTLQVNTTDDNSTPLSRPGPEINGRPTTITLLSPAQLRRSRFLPSLMKVANEAFAAGHVSNKVMPGDVARIPAEKNLLEELDKGPGSFTYIIHYNDTDVVGTCSMWHFTYTPVLEAVGATPEQLEKIRRGKTFNRQTPMPEGVMGWEMKLLFVDPAAQGHGLALLLMRLCEDEAQRRYQLRQDTSLVKLRFILTCINEIMGKFYKKRGYTIDYEVWQPIGTLGSETGFHVTHMSRTVE